MAFSGSMLTAIPPTHPLDKNTGGFQPAATRVHPFRIRCKGNSDLEAPKKLFFSRRDSIISLISLSSAAISMSSPDIAEARNKKPEIRRKIKEKLDLLREKAGVSKQKESDKGKLPPTPPSAEKEKNIQLQPPPLPLPEPPLGRDISLVEAAYDLSHW